MSRMPPIPQTDPKAKIDVAIQHVLDSGRYILGRDVDALSSWRCRLVASGRAIWYSLSLSWP